MCWHSAEQQTRYEYWYSYECRILKLSDSSHAILTQSEKRLEPAADNSVGQLDRTDWHQCPETEPCTIGKGYAELCFAAAFPTKAGCCQGPDRISVGRSLIYDLSIGERRPINIKYKSAATTRLP